MIFPPFKPLRWKRFTKAGDRGQALAELALTTPILLTLLLGAAEFARFAYLAIEMSNAAKAAAQYGAQNSLTSYDTVGMQAVAQQDAPDAYKACTNFTTTIQETCGCKSGGTVTSTSCGSSCSTGYAWNYLTVNTSAQCAPLIFPKGHGATLTLTGQAIQEVLR